MTLNALNAIVCTLSTGSCLFVVVLMARCAGVQELFEDVVEFLIRLVQSGTNCETLTGICASVHLCVCVAPVCGHTQRATTMHMLIIAGDRCPPCERSVVCAPCTK